MPLIEINNFYHNLNISSLVFFFTFPVEICIANQPYEIHVYVSVRYKLTPHTVKTFGTDTTLSLATSNCSEKVFR